MDDSKDLDALLSQLKFDFDDNLLNSTAATITSAAGTAGYNLTMGSGTANITSTWPYSLGGAGGGSAGGYTWTTNGTGGYNLGTTINPSLSFSDNWHNDAKLKVQGDAEFDGDVKIKGKSITEMFAKIEERLGILYPNEKLEAKWEELKKLGDAYRALEKDILEKEQIWETLKK
jgi:hypothetical protein